jgi:hypothetical protein
MLHKEYGGGKGTRIDIVAFHPKQLRKITNPNLTDKNKKYLVPMIAFELGTEKTDDALSHYKNDMGKLEKASDRGYLIHIFKDVTQSRKGTQSRENTETKIQKKFKSVFESNKPQTNNVKVLAILIRTFVNQKRIIGKCEIFDSKKAEWNKVNISKSDDIDTAILKQIN